MSDDIDAGLLLAIIDDAEYRGAPPEAVARLRALVLAETWGWRDASPGLMASPLRPGTITIADDPPIPLRGVTINWTDNHNLRRLRRGN
jgi:hypothetical protein